MRHCTYCSQPVNPDDATTYRRIKGWTRKAASPTRKGGSDVELREPGNEFAHGHCVSRLKLGLSVEQGTLA